MDGNWDSQGGGWVLSGEGKEYSNGPNVHAKNLKSTDYQERADELIELLAGAAPDRGTALKLVDPDTPLNEMAIAYIELMEKAEEIGPMAVEQLDKLLHEWGNEDKIKKSKTTGKENKEKEASSDSIGIDPAARKPNNIYYSRSLKSNMIVIDSTGRATYTPKPAKDKVPKKPLTYRNK